MLKIIMRYVLYLIGLAGLLCVGEAVRLDKDMSIAPLFGCGGAGLLLIAIIEGCVLGGSYEDKG